MKIYNRKYFFMGVAALCVLLFYALRFVLQGSRVDGMLYLILTVFAIRCLHIGLSEIDSRRLTFIAENYSRVAKELYGKYAFVKTNLPPIVACAYVLVLLLLWLIRDEGIPGAGTFIPINIGLILLSLSVFYDAGIRREVLAQIEREMPETE